MIPFSSFSLGHAHTLSAAFIFIFFETLCIYGGSTFDLNQYNFWETWGPKNEKCIFFKSTSGKHPSNSQKGINRRKGERKYSLHTDKITEKRFEKKKWKNSTGNSLPLTCFLFTALSFSSPCDTSHVEYSYRVLLIKLYQLWQVMTVKIKTKHHWKHGRKQACKAMHWFASLRIYLYRNGHRYR